MELLSTEVIRNTANPSMSTYWLLVDAVATSNLKLVLGTDAVAGAPGPAFGVAGLALSGEWELNRAQPVTCSTTLRLTLPPTR